MFIGVIAGGLFGGQYRSAEMCVIPWGDGPQQLYIEEPYREYSDDINGDTIGFMETGNGPGTFFVDKNDNIYIQSGSLNYFKAFHSDGSLLVNYSPGNNLFNYGQLFNRGIERFYVDSLCNIYVSGLLQKHIVIVDTLYKLINRIKPDFVDSSDYIIISNWGSQDMISISAGHAGCMTYKNGEFKRDGTFYGWLAIDNFYYYVLSNADSVLRIVRFNSINERCYAQAYDSVFAFDMDEIIGCHLLGVTDSMLLCIIYNPYSDSLNNYIRFYDTTGKIIDQFMLLPQLENHYLYYIYEPFFRADGCIFQFLCQDDGLHVIKWSKQ